MNEPRVMDVKFTPSSGLLGALACEFGIHSARSAASSGPPGGPCELVYCTRCGRELKDRWEWVWTTHDYPFSVSRYRPRGPA